MKVLLVLVVLAAVAFEVNAHRGGGKGKGMWHKCGDDEANMEGFDKEKKACKAELNLDGGDNKKMWKKMVSCVIEKRGVLVDNKINDEKFIESMKVLFPKKGEEMAKSIAAACFKPENTDSLNKEDPSTFMKLGGCIHNEWKTHCGKGGKPSKAAKPAPTVSDDDDE